MSKKKAAQLQEDWLNEAPQFEWWPQFENWRGGHNDWTGNLVICEETQQRCLIMLGNSVRAEVIYPEIIALVLGETDFPFWWTYPELQNGRP